jgi:hypothetical protein
MYYIGLDIHKKTISYYVKDVSGRIHQEGKIGATRRELNDGMKTLPQPWTVAMEVTIFTGWVYDHVLPHATAVKVAHPVMLRAIAAAKKKNDRIDAGKIADCLRCDFLQECHMASTEVRDRRRRSSRYHQSIVHRPNTGRGDDHRASCARRGRTRFPREGNSAKSPHRVKKWRAQHKKSVRKPHRIATAKPPALAK